MQGVKNQRRHRILSIFYEDWDTQGKNTMLATILQDFAELMKTRVLEITAEFEKNLDFGALEKAITQELAILGAALHKAMLTALLENAVFLSCLLYTSDAADE